MMHKAWCSIEEVPYCFSRQSIKFQGHKGQKIDDLDQIWARLLGRSQLSNPSDLPCYILHLKNNGRSPPVPLHQPSLVTNMSEPETQFKAYLISSLNDIGKHGKREQRFVVGMHAGGNSARPNLKSPITSRSRLSISNNSTVGFRLWSLGALSPRRISDVPCLASIGRYDVAVILGPTYSVGEHCGIISIPFLFDLFVLINGFIRKCHT